MRGSVCASAASAAAVRAPPNPGPNPEKTPTEEGAGSEEANRPEEPSVCRLESDGKGNKEDTKDEIRRML